MKGLALSESADPKEGFVGSSLHPPLPLPNYKAVMGTEMVSIKA